MAKMCLGMHIWRQIGQPPAGNNQNLCTVATTLRFQREGCGVFYKVMPEGCLQLIACAFVAKDVGSTCLNFESFFEWIIDELSEACKIYYWRFNFTTNEYFLRNYEMLFFFQYRLVTYRPDDHFHRHSRRSPFDAFSFADDGTYARQAVTWTVRLVPVWAVGRAWSCTIVESYWG